MISWDGKELDERFFRAKESGDEVWELSALYTFGKIGGAPSLQENWDPKRMYDMADFSEIISDFVVIGEEVSGGALLLCLIDGEIWFLAHDYPAEDDSLHIGESSSLFRVANDFRELRRLLLSTDENDDNDAFGRDWYEDAELRRAKNEKIQEERRLRKLMKFNKD